MDPARDALIVATADYHDPKLQQLRAPVADAHALARVLEDQSIGGFDVQLALDEDESVLTRRLARFFSDRRPDDLLLLHFSCHGIKDASGELYMAAADTETDLLSATGIPSRWLSEQIGKCRSKRIVVLLDCCFSGSFPFGTHYRAGESVHVQQHLLARMQMRVAVVRLVRIRRVVVGIHVIGHGTAVDHEIAGMIGLGRHFETATDGAGGGYPEEIELTGVHQVPREGHDDLRWQRDTG